MMKRIRLQNSVAASMREIIFGLEDSLVSTLGTITGIAAGTGSTYIVLLSGSVLVVVESISMSAGSYLSSKTAAEVMAANGEGRNMMLPERPMRAGIVMFFAYILGGLFPLAPYVFLPVHLAYVPSIFITLFVLFATGVWKARFTHRSPWKSGCEMTLISAVAAALGYVIGRLVSTIGDVSL